MPKHPPQLRRRRTPVSEAQALESRVLLSAVIIDDTSSSNPNANFTISGEWTNFTNGGTAGRNGTFRYTMAPDIGNPEIARWNYSGLQSGTYRVSTTWWASANRTAAAHYTVRDNVGGNLLGSANLNQKLTPNDFTSESSSWEDIGYVNVVNGNLIVELTNHGNVNQYVIADAVRIERVGDVTQGPKISVTEGSLGFVNGAETVAYGTVVQNTEAIRTFAIFNSGTADLTVSAITVPAGFALASTQPSTISAGTSATFSVRMTGSTLGTASGTVSITSNAAGSSPFTFQVSGQTIAHVIDDGEIGFSTTGSWTPFAGAIGNDNDFEYFQYTTGGNGSDVARWSFDNLASGQYRISTTWTTNANRTTSANYTIFDGLNGAVLGAASINQTLAPNDLTDQNTTWEDLGLVNVSNGQLLVELSNLAAANKYVIADAIRIERVGAIPQSPKITVQAGNSGLISGSSSFQFGSHQQGHVVNQTFTVHNSGTTTLTLGTITVPSGFSMVTTPPATLQAGQSFDLVVRLNTVTVGAYSGTLQISSNDLTQSPFQITIQGTVTTQTGGANQPEVSVYHLDGNIVDGSGEVSFGTVSQGSNVSKTFVIKNTGSAALTISNLVVPPLYFLTSPPATTIAAGEQTTFTIQLDTIWVGAYNAPVNSATLSFSTNDSDESVFSFNVLSLVTARVVDNRDSGFRTVGPWNYYSSSSGAGRENDVYYIAVPASSAGTNFAYWEFNDLLPGLYRVSTTWTAGSNRSTSAEYRVLSEIGGPTLSLVHANQTLSPVAFTDQGTIWNGMGADVVITGGKLIVQLSDRNVTAANAGKLVVADAIRVQRLSQGLRIDALDSQASETPQGGAPNTAVFRINRGSVYGTPLTVYFDPPTGSATEGVDYYFSGGSYNNRTVVIPADQSYVDVTLNVLNDGIVEDLESITLKIAQPPLTTYYPDPYASSATATIANIDEWITSVVATDSISAELPIGETPNAATFEISRTGSTDLSSPLEVYFTLSGTAEIANDFTISGAGYSATNNYDGNGNYLSTVHKVVIAAGQSSSQLTLTAINDDAKEALETISVSLNTSSAYVVDSIASSATASIVDNDQWIASIQALDDSAAERAASQSADTATFQVSRGGETDLTHSLDVFLTIAGNAVLGTDYSLSGATYSAVDNYDGFGVYVNTTFKVTIPAGQASSQITLTAINDNLKESLETAIIGIQANGNYSINPTAASDSASIEDNDQWEVSIQAVDGIAQETVSGQTTNTATLEITRTGSTDTTFPLEVTLDFSGSALFGTDYTVSGATYTSVVELDENNQPVTIRKVVIPAGQYGTQITITAVLDEVTESTEALVVALNASASFVLDDDANTALVEIRDVNLSPTVDEDQSFQISESAVNSQIVGTVLASDPENDTLQFSITSGNGAGVFQINSVTGVLSIADNSLLDYETTTTYTLMIKVTDASNLDTLPVAVTINVTNVNESPTDIELTNSSVDENEPIGTIVGTLSATDQDTDDSFTYALVSGVGGEDNASFTINSSNQVVALASFNFEQKQIYRILVRVTDTNGTGLSFTKSLEIAINDVNEAPTGVSLDNATPNLPEDVDTTARIHVADIVVSDDALGTNSISLTGVDSSLFEVDGNQLYLKAGTSLDYETKSSYSLTVRVQDSAFTSWVSEDYVINITDENDAPTNISLSASNISENLPVGTVVGEFSTTDQDIGNTFTYTFVGTSNDNASFSIDGNQLKASTIFNFEIKNSYTIRVRSEDQDGLYFEKEFTITINDVNEPPVISAQTFNVPEDATDSAVVGTVIASDPEEDAISYEIVSGNASGAFAISQSTGQITVANSSLLDHEAIPSYTLMVRASDSTHPNATPVAVTINVTDVNEAPTDLQLSNDTVNENEPVGTVVGVFTAQDEDDGDILVYTLASGSLYPDNVYFEIVGNQLRTKAEFDFESNPDGFSIGVIVTDLNGTGISLPAQNFDIELINVYEPPYAIVSYTDAGNAQHEIADNTGEFDFGLALINVPRSVVFEIRNSGDTEDLIVSGIQSNNAKFSITQIEQGGVTITPQPNDPLTIAPLESLFFTVTFMSSDAGEFSGEISFTTDVVSQNPFNFTVSGDATANVPPVITGRVFNLPEDVENGQVIGSFTATDLNEEDVLSFVFVSGNEAGTFRIEKDLETENEYLIIVNDNTFIDYELLPQFNLVIRAIDPFLEFDEAGFTITVTNVNEPPQISELEITISELTATGTVIGHVFGHDPEGASLTYSTNDPVFGIDVVGDIYVANATLLTSESSPYSMTITVSDGINNVSLIVTIYVLDSAEPATPITLNTAEYEVAYNQALKFNPAYQYELANGYEFGNEPLNPDYQYTLQIQDSNGVWRSVGETITLTYGSIVINSDFSVTYTPAGDLLTRPTDHLSPALDANDDIVRFEGLDEDIQFRVIQQGSASSSNPPVFAEGDFSVLVFNSAPAFIGANLADEAGGVRYFPIDSRINLDVVDAPNDNFGNIVQLDVRDLFNDAENDGIKILRVVYDKSVTIEPTGTTQHSVKIGTTNSVDRFLFTNLISDHKIEIYNQVSYSNLTGNWASSGPSQLSFEVFVTDGSLDENGNPNEWVVSYSVFPRRSVSATWFGTTLSTPYETRSWITRVSERSVNVDPSIDAAKWSVDAESRISDRDSDSVQNVGGTNIDLQNGQVLLSQSLTLDQSGGNAEVALPSLIFDGSTAGIIPTIQATIAREAAQTKPASIDVKLRWFDHHNSSTTETTASYTVDSGNNDDNYLISMQPQNAPTQSGVYAWNLEVTLNFNINGIPQSFTLEKRGQTAVIVKEALDSSSSNIDNNDRLGSGWSLGMPQLVVDDRGRAGTIDDTIMLAFPGESVKLFKTLAASTTDFNYSGGFQSYSTDSSAFSATPFFAPQEYGELRFNSADQSITYKAANGTEYHFQKFTKSGTDPQWLLVRVEQPGLDFTTSSSSTSARQGLTIQRDSNATGATLGRIISITSSDGRAATFSYDINGYVDKIVDAAGREVDLSIQDGELQELRLKNALPTGVSDLTIKDSIRRWTYDSNGNVVTDKLYSAAVGSTSGEVLERETSYKYDHFDEGSNTGTTSGEFLSEIVYGSEVSGNALIYKIQPLALAGLLTNGSSRLLANNESLKATVAQSATDLMKSDGTAGVSWPEETIVLYTFNLKGQLTRKETIFVHDRADEEDQGHELWTYDYVGNVKTYTDVLGRETLYYYDYEIPQSYEDGTSDSSSQADAAYQYDQNDYRGNVVKIVGVEGITTFEYETDDEMGDAVGKLIRTTDARGTTTKYEYDTSGRMLSTRIIRGTEDTAAGDDYLEQWEYYDNTSSYNGLLKSHTNELGLKTTYVEYDTHRRIVRSSVSDTSVAFAQTLVYQSTYDQFGSLNTVAVYHEDADVPENLISTTNYDYDALGQLLRLRTLSPNSTVLTESVFEYASDGQVTATIDGNGTRSTSVYDLAGLMISSTVAVGEVFNGQSVEKTLNYAYYDNGMMKSVTNSDGSITEYFYDLAERMDWASVSGVAGEISSSLAPTSANFVKQVTKTVRDEAGRVTEEENLLTGQTVSYEYDDLRNDQPTAVETSFNNGTEVKSQKVDYRYNANGQVIFEQTRGQVYTRYAYDELGHLKQQSSQALHGAVVDLVTDAAGNVTQQIEHRQTYSSGGTWVTTPLETEFTYDQRGRLRVTTDALNGTATTNISFDTTEKMMKIISTTRDGLVTTTFIDAAGRTAKAINSTGGTTTMQYDYVSNVISETFTPASGDTIPARQVAYSYDALNRLRVTTQNSAISQSVDYFDHSQYSYGFDVVVTDANGQQTGIVQDTLGQTILIRQPDPGINSITGQNAADDTPYQLISYAYDSGNQTLAVTVTMTQGNSSSLTLKANDSERTVSRTTSSTLGNVLKVEKITNLAAGTWVTVESNEYLYSGLLARNVANGIDTSYYYDTNVDGTGTGLLVRSVHPYSNRTGNAGITEAYLRDSAGNITQVSQGEGFLPENRSASTKIYRSYDALNRIVSESKLIPVQDSEAGEIAAPAGTLLSRTWIYDGLTTRYTDLNQHTTITTYNPASRIQTTQVKDASENILYNSTINYHSDGSIQSASDSQSASNDYAGSQSAIGYTYDAFGRVIQTLQNINAQNSSFLNNSYTLDYIYYDGGQTQSRTVSINGTAISTVSQFIDGLGRTRAMAQTFSSAAVSLWTNNAVPTTRGVAYEYRSDGQRETLARYLTAPSSSSGVFANNSDHGFSKYGYAENGQLSSIDHQRSLSDTIHISSFVVIYNDAGQLIFKDATYNTATGSALPKAPPEEYRYNSKGELVAPTSLPDANGNLLAAGQVYSFDNRLLEDNSTEYVYDNEGRLIHRTDKITGVYEAFSWDHRGLMLSHDVYAEGGALIVDIDFYYDVWGSKTGFREDFKASLLDPTELDQLTEVYFLLDGGQRILELDASTQKLVRNYFWSTSGEILATDQDQKTQWAFSDMEGSVTTWGNFDASSQTWMLNHQSFDSYGKSSRGVSGDYAYTQDLLTVWHGTVKNEGYFEATYLINGSTYDPGLKRYISPTGNLNPYTFGNNNPNFNAKSLPIRSNGSGWSNNEPSPFGTIGAFGYGAWDTLTFGNFDYVFGTDGAAEHARQTYGYAAGSLVTQAVIAAYATPLAIGAYGFSGGFFGLTATNATFGTAGLYGLGHTAYQGYQTYQNWDRLSGPERLLAVGSPVAGLVGGGIGAALTPRSALYTSALSGALARGYVSSSMLSNTGRLTAGYPAAIVAQARITPSSLGAKSIVENTRLHRMWEDSIKELYYGKGRTGSPLRRYLDGFETGVTPTSDQARAAFNSVRSKFIDKVDAVTAAGESFPGYAFDEIHHWNWHLGDNSFHAIDPRQLFPVNGPTHDMIHLRTTIGPVNSPLDIYFQPINPLHKIDLDFTYPLAPRNP